MKIEDMKKNLKQEIKELNSKTACFTGHRAQKLPWKFNENDVGCLAMKEIAKLKIIGAIWSGKEHFISGMALGFDIIAAEIVLELKKEYPFITLECALPCKDQDKMWPPQQKERYKKILSQADKIRCIYDHYVDGCMQERNRYMINNSSLLIALFNGLPGGTKQTIDYAKKQNKEIVIIKP